ncbi:MAG: alkyl/aryl-sulfatase [Acidimicrobiales bacterium]
MSTPDPKPATHHTVEAQRRVAASMSFDEADFDRATRGLVATHPTGRIERPSGQMVWDVNTHDFVRERDESPDQVNPSLWRQARLNSIHGLFEITDGVWQARGYDISNITFMAGTDGWVIIDPLTTAETAAACLELANDHLGARPVTAVIYTHSHVDHFGGVRGVIDDDDVANGVRVIAPEGFLTEAVAENVIAGPVMGRRAQYMYGGMLAPGAHGQVDAGLGKTTPRGTVGLIAPTEIITDTGTELTIDGIRTVFQNTPGSEAPAEMNFHFPDKRLLCMAENCSHNMHNLYTPRGAQVRDALAWSKYINEAIELFAHDTDICFASHHWPRFDTDDSRQFLEKQRDVYRWLHDQTMRLANHGATAVEIAETLELAPELADQSHTRGYYGTVSHNAKAVYQRYLGWFDGNPANLEPLPPTDSSPRYIELMGGAEAVLEAARAAFEQGEYRWVAELVNRLVFAEPDNEPARLLQADALEQLGYQAESGPWRNFYLTGAQELRHGVVKVNVTAGTNVLAALTIEQLFDAIGVRVNGPAVSGSRVTINWHFTDIDEQHVLGLANSAIHHRPFTHDAEADASITMTKASFGAIMMGRLTFADAMAEGDISLDGDADSLLVLFGNLDGVEPGFNIVTP